MKNEGRRKRILNSEKKAAVFRKPEFWNNLFEGMVDRGLSLREYSAVTGVPYGETLRQIHRSEALEDRWKLALRAKAYGKVEEIEEVTWHVLRGEIDANSGRAASDNLKWLAEKLDGERWGKSQRHDINVTNLNDKHLSAMKELTSPNVIEGEVVDSDGEDGD